METPDKQGSEGYSEPLEARPVRERAVSAVTLPVRVAAAWSWRVLLIIAAVATGIYFLSYVSLLVVSFLVALLFAALLEPVVSFLKRSWKMGLTGAAAVGLLFGLVILIALLALALTQLIRQLPALLTQTADGFDELLGWIADGPLASQSLAFQDWLTDLQGSLGNLFQQYGSSIAMGAFRLASGTLTVLSGSLLMLFTLFFLLRDGRQVWIVVVRSLPAAWRTPVNEAAIRGWVTLGEYVRTLIKVAAIDAVGIGLGAFALGVPLAVPIAVLVFLCSFIPILGAIASGATAVMIALVNNGVKAAIIMFVIVLAVQQLESYVLHPWMMAHVVALHPLVVVLAVVGGGAIAGIPGALFAVPLLAFLNVTFMYLHGHDPYPGLAENPERPGGPPGSLDKQIKASYRTYTRTVVDESKVAKKVRAKAQARAEVKGHVLIGPGLEASGLSSPGGQAVPVNPPKHEVDPEAS